jgi:hypothetical protein
MADSSHYLRLLSSSTKPLLVWQYQRALNYISTYHASGPFCVPGHSGIHGNEIANELAGEGSTHHSVGTDPALGVSRQSVKRKIQC